MVEKKKIAKRLLLSSYLIIGSVIFLAILLPLVYRFWGLIGLIIPTIGGILLFIGAWEFEKIRKLLKINSATDFYDLINYGKQRSNNRLTTQEFKKIGSIVSMITVLVFLILLLISFAFVL